MLKVGELGAGFCARGFAGVEDFSAEFGTGCAEEVCFLDSSLMFCIGRGDGGGGRVRTFSTSDLLTKLSFATSKLTARKPLTAFMRVTL